MRHRWLRRQGRPVPKHIWFFGSLVFSPWTQVRRILALSKSMMPPTEHQDVRVWHGGTDWTNLMLQPSDSAVTFQRFFGTNRFSLHAFADTNELSWLKAETFWGGPKRP